MVLRLHGAGGVQLSEDLEAVRGPGVAGGGSAGVEAARGPVLTAGAPAGPGVAAPSQGNEHPIPFVIGAVQGGPDALDGGSTETVHLQVHAVVLLAVLLLVLVGELEPGLPDAGLVLYVLGVEHGDVVHQPQVAGPGEVALAELVGDGTGLGAVEAVGVVLVDGEAAELAGEFLHERELRSGELQAGAGDGGFPGRVEAVQQNAEIALGRRAVVVGDRYLYALGLGEWADGVQ